MAATYETGAIYTATVPNWIRIWYEQQLLDNVRMNCILVPYAKVVEDFTAVKADHITYTEVQDAEPNWNATTENTLWYRGSQLDSRTITLNLRLYHDIMKFSDYNNLVEFVNGGQIPPLIREKLSRSLEETLDILARNAFLTHPTPTYSGAATTRATLTAADVFDPDIAELARVHLEELEVPGVASNADGGGAAVLCITTPRVIHDIRTAAGSDWLDVNNYQSTGRKFTSEAGQWGGVRFIKTNRMRLRNAGLATVQTQLNGATVAGQGAAALVDTVYAPGQAGATPHIVVTSSAGFVVGQYVTIHAQTLGVTVLDTDGTQETRRIVSIDTGGANRLSFDKPLLKPHLTTDYVTKAMDIHTSLFIGGPGIVYGIAERPNFYVPPKIDDAMMINRVGWRGFFSFQLWSPSMYEVHYSAGSTT